MDLIGRRSMTDPLTFSPLWTIRRSATVLAGGRGRDRTYDQSVVRGGGAGDTIIYPQLCFHVRPHHASRASPVDSGQESIDALGVDPRA